MPLKGLIIDNGIGSGRGYPDQDEIVFDRVTTSRNFRPDLSRYDLLIVPNGADHVAMFRIRDQVREMLAAGKAVFCFCGWFTDWIPGHRWVHDNSHPTKEMRHFPGSDPQGLMKGFEPAFLDHNQHGISGWWACGYIESDDPETVLVRDTWGRGVVIADGITTNGFLFLTASGPVGDYSSYPAWSPLAILYKNMLKHVIDRANQPLRKTLSK
jgi:hypothetical protein